MPFDEELHRHLSSLNDQALTRTDIMRLPFGYPGSKFRSAHEILPELPYRKLYGEAYGGSGAILLSRHQSHCEVFNDRCAGITALYRVIRDRAKLDEFLNRIKLALHSREEWTWCRHTWKSCEDEVERAARWYYMVIMSFNQKGRYFGRATTGKGQVAPKLDRAIPLFGPLHARLKHVQIENQDFRQLLADFDSYDMVWYLDPPYPPGFVTAGFYEHEMRTYEHVELCDRIFGKKAYPGLRGFVALSSYQNNIYDNYPWTRKKTWMVPVRVLGQIFCPENNLAGMEDLMVRGEVEECLYILDQ